MCLELVESIAKKRSCRGSSTAQVASMEENGQLVFQVQIKGLIPKCYLSISLDRCCLIS